MDATLKRHDPFARNSLDIVRVLAALHVALWHLCVVIPGARTPLMEYLLGFVPSVPIFFFISGFVISGAWNRNSNIRHYAIARILRIYPALWLSTALSLIFIVALYDHAVLVEHVGGMALWVFNQLVLPGWNPAFLRGYGSGVPNGALWTISVELGFYVVTPVLLILGHRYRITTPLLIAVMAVSLLINIYAHYRVPSGANEALLQKALTVAPGFSVPTWLWLFAYGALLQHWFARLRPVITRNFWPLAALTVAVTYLSSQYYTPGLLRYPGNNVGLINMLVIGPLVLSFAYHWPTLSDKLMRGSDVSYGIYIFHLPVMNAFVQVGATGHAAAALALGIAVLLASASWVFVEKPAMKLKKRLHDRTKDAPSVILASELSA